MFSEHSLFGASESQLLDFRLAFFMLLFEELENSQLLQTITIVVVQDK